MNTIRGVGLVHTVDTIGNSPPHISKGVCEIVLSGYKRYVSNY